MWEAEGPTQASEYPCRTNSRPKTSKVISCQTERRKDGGLPFMGKVPISGPLWCWSYRSRLAKIGRPIQPFPWGEKEELIYIGVVLNSWREPFDKRPFPPCILVVRWIWGWTSGPHQIALVHGYILPRCINMIRDTMRFGETKSFWLAARLRH